MKQTIENRIPELITPRITRIQSLGDLLSGIACGLLFGLIVPEEALFHSSILAVIAIFIGLAISKFVHIRYLSKTDAGLYRPGSLLQELLYVVLPFPIAIWAATLSVLAMTKR